jgi:hypothetical protein
MRLSGIRHPYLYILAGYRPLSGQAPVSINNALASDAVSAHEMPA